MRYRPTPFISAEETGGMPQVQRPDQKPPRKRSTHFLQMLAAVLLVGGLLAGFLMLFASRPQSQNSQVASQLTPQVQPPGIFLTVSSIARAANPNEQDGSILWHYQTGANTAFAIGNGIVYTGKDEVTSMFTPNPGRLRLLVALNATNGNVIWSHDNIDPLGITQQNGTICVQSIAADNTGSDKRYFLSAWTSSGDKLWLETGPAQEPVAINGGFLIIDTGSRTTTVGPGYTSYVAQNGVLYAAYRVQTSDTSTHQSTASFLQALNVQTGTVIWSQKVGTSDLNITHKGSQTVISMPKSVGLQLGSYSSILLSQNTLSIVAGTSIYTFSLAGGQQLWHSTIKIAGDVVDFVESVYIAPQRS